MNSMDDKTSARFWAKVDVKSNNECWNWTASKNGDGYGTFGIKGNIRGAHRIAYEDTFGKLGPGLVVRHKCDNRACCNPAHMERGTQLDNIRDRCERGRSNRPKGSRNGRTNLTEDQVREIRLDTRPQKIISVDYSISASAVSAIKRGKSWTHVG